MFGKWRRNESTHVDDAEARVFEIGGDGEVDEVVDGVADASEVVDGPVPDEVVLVPVVAVDHRPAAEVAQDLPQRSQAQLLGSRWSNPTEPHHEINFQSVMVRKKLEKNLMSCHLKSESIVKIFLVFKR